MGRIGAGRKFIVQSRFKSTLRSLKSKYDAIVVGAGHNGLVSAAYLQKAGLNVLVLERRHVLGGAAVTEEIVPGFKFSRCSYVLSLLRPQIMEDLKLKDFGLKLYFRDPNYFTPLADGRYLLLGSDSQKNYDEISKFSKQDAKMFLKYEDTLSRLVEPIGPFLDHPPLDVNALLRGSLRDKMRTLPSLRALMKTVQKLGTNLPLFYDLLTAPATKIS